MLCAKFICYSLKKRLLTIVNHWHWCPLTSILKFKFKNDLHFSLFFSQNYFRRLYRIYCSIHVVFYFYDAFLLFWSMKAPVPVHVHYIKKRDQDITIIHILEHTGLEQKWGWVKRRRDKTEFLSIRFVLAIRGLLLFHWEYWWVCVFAQPSWSYICFHYSRSQVFFSHKVPHACAVQFNGLKIKSSVFVLNDLSCNYWWSWSWREPRLTWSRGSPDG